VSLATTAFFGVGAYTVAVLGEVLAWPLVLLIATAIGALMAVIVGVSTLRLSGLHFVIFTFGLAELVRQLVIWYEVNKTRVLGRYVFVDITQNDIYWQLLALAVAVFAIGWLITRSRLGFALRIIARTETWQTLRDQRHACKVTLFAISAVSSPWSGRSWRRAGPISSLRSRSIRRCCSGRDHGAARRRAPGEGRRSARSADALLGSVLSSTST
jgi:branched-chain amino acid transport system permease protein